MIECLSPEHMNLFVSMLDKSIVEFVEPAAVIIHAAVGDVQWVYNETINLFCIEK